jgi:hypothetical protein
MQAVLLASFLRALRNQDGRLFNNIGDFFQSEGDQVSGAQRLRTFAENKPASVQAVLRRIVPQNIQTSVGVFSWDWLNTAEGDGMLDLLERTHAEVIGDLDLYYQLEVEAATTRNYALSQHFQSVARTIRSRSLLGFLASRNLLPKYGFPTDIVELKTDHLPVAEASKVQLQRDLRIAIAEYAPGAEIVAAKRIWTGGGLYKQPKKDWPIYHYAICPGCGRFHRGTEEVVTICGCGSSLRERRQMYGTFIVPEFGFVAARDQTRMLSEARPQRLYASRVYFAEYAPPQREEHQRHEPSFEIVPELSSSNYQVRKYYSRFGKLALVNPGVAGRGFRICQWCGYAEISPEASTISAKRRNKPPAHKHPRTGRDCSGYFQTHHLGHEFLTDVVELRFSGKRSGFGEEKLWRSLGIRRDDLDGTLYFHSVGEPPSVVLFDNVPGGAGHVLSVARDLPSVFRTTLQRVNRDCCGPETSCYECLRNYRNQPYHDKLQRGLVYNFIHDLLHSADLPL